MSEPAIAVVGLGYVGLPLAVALAKHYSCVGFDISSDRIDALKQGVDATGEIGSETLKASALRLSDNSDDLRSADIFIVTVPTPVDAANRPDPTALRSASEMVGKHLAAGRSQIVVYESTVYPGLTEGFCREILESASQLECGRDFFLGYSPERINPGDREHTVDRITKVVAGQTVDVLDRLCDVYGSITTGGVYRAPSIKVAEAAKVIENAQRDINIAFMNEIAMIFQRVGISTHDVLEAAGTKWNFLNFKPGLVGGHCIGVDPYYLSYLAQQIGHRPNVILAGRAINDGMANYVADELHGRLRVPGKVLVLGLTFKEDVPDLRNSKVVDLIRRLEWLGHEIIVHDPQASPDEAKREYGLVLDVDALTRQYSAVVLAVPHSTYREMSAPEIIALLEPQGLVVDLKAAWSGLKLETVAKVWKL